MTELTVKFDSHFQNACLCEYAQLDQIFQHAEIRQQQARPDSSEDIGSLLSKIATELETRKLDAEPITRELGTIAISLAKMITQKVVGNSESLQTERLEKIVSETLSQAAPVTCIYVNPGNHDAIHAHFQSCDGLRDVELRSDANVVNGECRIESGSNSLVSSLDNQLREIEARLLELNDHA